MAGDFCVYLIISSPETWVLGTARMLIWVFHCCNGSLLHKFTTILATYGLSLPFYPSGLMHSIHLMLRFTWDRRLITSNWIYASWRDQFRCQDSGVIILMSTPMSINPSITTLSIHTLSFGLWSFIEVCQNIHFLFPSGVFDSCSMSIPSLKTICFFPLSHCVF